MHVNASLFVPDEASPHDLHIVSMLSPHAWPSLSIKSYQQQSLYDSLEPSPSIDCMTLRLFLPQINDRSSR